MAAERFDVLVVGAGLSGIGAAVQLQRDHPKRRVVILESRDDLGGTWDLFRYPGVRSDSDMQSLGYPFRPWTDERTIAPGGVILDYLRDTAHEYGLDDVIRYRHRVVSADFDGDTAEWTVRAVRRGTGDDGDEVVSFRCSFLYACCGYYNYTVPYTPQLPGIAGFRGTVVHPQHWPAELEWADKNVVVIGSGATAVTLVPALAHTARRVTMLQRSPTHIGTLPSRDARTVRLARWLPDRLAYRVARTTRILQQSLVYRCSRLFPRLVAAILRRSVRAQLPAGFDVDTHFRPRYAPWDQRLCLAPDGDLFTAIREGRATVATDRISGFTADSITLESGAALPADIIVTATGLNVLFLGGMGLSVDGTRIDPRHCVAYKATMLSGIPNFFFAVGYGNASWTLKISLANEFISRLLTRMDQRGSSTVTPRVAEGGGTSSTTSGRPLLGLTSGYLTRAGGMLPTQGERPPWRIHESYFRDARLFRRGRIEGDGLEFGGPAQPRNTSDNNSTITSTGTNRAQEAV
ncbi:MAG: putative flavoprotein involved in transport [Glaciihabitans sp.]|nr:putative flavoprotein involved in transport [Glaciihabitans sp.]